MIGYAKHSAQETCQKYHNVRCFINLNKRCFNVIAKIFPQTHSRDNGKSWHLQDERKRFHHIKVIALDPSEEQLKNNHDADEKILFAMGRDSRAPLDDASLDIVTSHMVLEHIPNNDFTMREISRILNPIGKFISAIPLR